MQVTTRPRVYLVASTEVRHHELKRYLADIGGPDWAPEAGVSSGDLLPEVAGRLCYRSWQAYDPTKPNATNPNVSRVREGNDRYIRNILESGHGSVLEHASATLLFDGVSRVFTHEICRHRAGVAISQESLRYVRLDQLRFWLPDHITKNMAARALFLKVVEELEQVQRDLAELFHIAGIKEFAAKKALTSTFRRLAPMGLGTAIMFTGNLRAWRHIVELRTSPAAEEEMRLVMGDAGAILKDAFPAVFQDMVRNEAGSWVTEHAKV